MARLSETDLKPNANMVRYDEIIHYHIDDSAVAAGFVGYYDKVFLCKAYVETLSEKQPFSQMYVFYIYTLDNREDLRLLRAFELYDDYVKSNDLYESNKNSVAYAINASRKYVEASRIMENYLSEKCGWTSSKIILYINCKTLTKDMYDAHVHDTEYVLSLFNES